MVHPWFQGGMPVGNEKEKFNAASIKRVAVLLLCVITILLISCTRMQPKPIDATPPILMNATLSTDGSRITLRFDIPMKPPSDAQKICFTVLADTVQQVIRKLQMNPANLREFFLDLQTPLAHGQTVTVGYTQGTIRSQGGGFLLSFTERNVQNNVPLGAPQYVRSQTNEAGNQIHIIFDRAMADPAGTQAQFSVVTTATAPSRGAPSRGILTVSSVSRSMTDFEEFILTVSPLIQNGETIELGYTRGTVQSSEGAYLESFSGKVVTNQVPGDAPILVSATLTEQGTQVIAAFDKPMKEPTPLQRSEFAVRADGITQTIVSLSRQPGNENAFIFTLQTPISFEKQVTLSYLKGTVQAQNDEYLGSFDDRLVTNEVPPGAPQYVRSQTNETGNQIHVFFDRTMADPTGTQAQFSVVTNSPASSRGVLTVSSVSRSMTDLEEFILSVSPVVQNGETIELGYTRGSVQSNEGAYLESFSGKVVTNQVPGDAPILLSATLTEHGTQVIATFDKPMKEPVSGQLSQFSVRVDGLARALQSLGRNPANEAQYLLELSSPASYGEQVTLTYIKGTVQAQNNEYLGSFVDRLVTNEVPPGAPQYVCSQTNETGNQIHVFFDRAMADPTGTQAQFSVVTNSPASSRGVLTVSSVSRSMTDLEEFILSVSPVVQNGETIELGYTRGSVQSNEGAYLESFSGKVVTNQVPGDAPILLSATLTEHGTQVIATFDKPMKEPVSGQLSQFSVRVDGLARALQSLGRNPANEAQYLLELSSPASYGEQVTLTYIKGTVQAQNNEYLGSFVDRLVTNEVPPGAPQYVCSQTNETGNQIHVFFDRAMADPTGTQAQFSVVTSSPSPSRGAPSRGVLTVNSVSRSTTDLEEFILTVSPLIQNEETIELGYTRGTVQSNEGAYLESFSGKVVTNQVPGDSPILVSATLTEHGTQVIATFDKTMKEPTLLQRSEFAVRADGITQTVVSLSREIGNESAFVLALQTPISFDKQVTLTYLKGTVQAQNEAFLSSFVDAIVTNLSQTPVRLTYPAQDQTDVGINLTLQWEGVTGAAGYRILFGDSPGSLIQQNVELVTDTWYTLREMLL